MSQKALLPNLGQLQIGVQGAGFSAGPPKKGRAFVFVVADHYGDEASDAKREMAGPFILVMRHRGTNGSYGIPGGMQDASDHGKLETAALREFAEEFLNLPKEVTDPKTGKKVDNQAVQKIGVAACLQLAYDGVRGTTLTNHPHKVPMGTYVMRVRSALQFEAKAADFNPNIVPNAPRAAKLKMKYLSDEMNGYAWISQMALKEAIAGNNVDDFARLLVQTTHNPKVYLPMRKYVFGTYSGGKWVPNSFTQKFVFG